MYFKSKIEIVHVKVKDIVEVFVEVSVVYE